MSEETAKKTLASVRKAQRAYYRRVKRLPLTLRQDTDADLIEAIEKAADADGVTPGAWINAHVKPALRKRFGLKQKS